MLSVADSGPPPPCPPGFDLVSHVLAPAARTPEKTALEVIGPSGLHRWSYARLEAAVLGTAGGLRARGLAPGDRLLLRLGNTVDFPVAFLGAIAAGIVPVPTSTQLTAPELATIAARVAPAAILAAEGLALPPGPARVVPAGEMADWREGPPLRPVPAGADSLAYIIFTSGTSGRARGVCHAHRAVWARRMMTEGWYGLTGEDRLLHAGAFNWTYTLGTGLLDPWAAGATALVPEPGVTPAMLPHLLRRGRATIFAAAPGIYRQMLRSNEALSLPELRHGLSAGEKLPERTRTAWEEATGTPVYEAFGMTECSTFLSGAPARPAPPGTLGFAQPGRRVAVLDAEGAPVPRGTIGTLAVHVDDPGLMLGYLDHAEETAARMAGPWFRTGDRAEMTPEGAFVYHGRDDDMMNAGGYRVSPVEVETALGDFPGLAEAAAVEVTVKADTTVIAAFYTSAVPLDEAALARHAAARLARYKMPRLFRRVPALPRNANGKLLRRRLRESFEADDDQA